MNPPVVAAGEGPRRPSGEKQARGDRQRTGWNGYVDPPVQPEPAKPQPSAPPTDAGDGTPSETKVSLSDKTLRPSSLNEGAELPSAWRFANDVATDLSEVQRIPRGTDEEVGASLHANSATDAFLVGTGKPSAGGGGGP